MALVKHALNLLTLLAVMSLRAVENTPY